jgi:hypothetical protein
LLRLNERKRFYGILGSDSALYEEFVLALVACSRIDGTAIASKRDRLGAVLCMVVQLNLEFVFRRKR